MADPLSAIASIAGVVTAGVQLANAVYQLSDKLKHAPQEMRDIASNMSLLSTILENLAEVLDQGRGVYKPRVLAETESILIRFQLVQKDVTRIVKRQRGFRGRMGWVFNSIKVGELLGKIEALKSAMNLVLWTVQLAIAHKTRQNNTKSSRFRNLVQSIVRENRQNIISLQNHASPPPYNALQSPDTAAQSATNDIHHVYVPKVNVETYSDVNDKWLDTGNRKDEASQPVAHSKDLIKASDAVRNDTATWLYRLVFLPDSTPLPTPLGESDNLDQSDPMNQIALSRQRTLNQQDQYSGEQSLARITSARSLRRDGMSNAVTNLLKAWTNLDQEEIASASFVDIDEEEWNGLADATVDASDIESEPVSEPTPTLDQNASTQPNNSANPNTPHPADTTSNPPPPPSPNFGNEEDEWYTDRFTSGARHAKPPRRTTYWSDRLDREERDELKRLKQKLQYEEQEARRRLEEDRVKKEYELRLAKEEAGRRRLAELEEEERKRIIVENTLKLERAEREGKEARARAVAEYQAKKAKEQAEFMAERERIIADYERKRAEEEYRAKAKEEEVLIRLKDEAARKAAEEQAQYEQFLRKQKEKEEAEQARQEAEAAREKAIVERFLENQRMKKEEEEAKAALEKASEEEQFARFLTRLKEMQGYDVSEDQAREVAKEALNGPTKPFVAAPFPGGGKSHHQMQYDMASELIDTLFGNAAQQVRTYRNANGDTLHFSTSNMGDAQRAREELEQIRAKYLSSSVPTLGDTHEEELEASTVRSDSGLDASSMDGQGQEEHEEHEEHFLLFRTKLNARAPQTQTLTTSLAEHSIEPLFELKDDKKKRRVKNNNVQTLDMTDSYQTQKNVMTGSLLWNPSAVPSSSELFEVLLEHGWKPIYVRGTDAGQTWYYGLQPLHVRFLKPDYVPQIQPEQFVLPNSYLLIGAEWIEGDALRLSGTEHKFISSGFWMLDPSIDYDEILHLIATSFMLREVTLRKNSKKTVLAPSSALSLTDKANSSTSSVPPMHLITGIPEPLRIQGDGASESVKS